MWINRYFKTNIKQILQHDKNFIKKIIIYTRSLYENDELYGFWNTLYVNSLS